MKIYVKETDKLKVDTILPLIKSSVIVLPFSLDADILPVDWVIVSQVDYDLLNDAVEFHVVIYESFYEELLNHIDKVYRYYHDYFYLKNSLKDAANKNIKTLITGSSYGAFGIDLSYIDDAVNLSSISQDLYYSSKLIYKACENNSNIENVVVCAGYYYFFSDLSLTKASAELSRVSKVYYPLLRDTHNCLLLPSKEDFCVQHSIIDIEGLLDTYASQEYQKGFFTDSYRRAQRATKVWIDKTKNWSELTSEEQCEAGKVRAEAHNKSMKHAASFNENIVHFQDLINYCNSKKINLLLVVTPATQNYLKYLDPECKRVYYSVFDKVDGLIHVLDLATDGSFDNILDFNDTDHLNDSGAVKLSKIINSVVKEINIR